MKQLISRTFICGAFTLLLSSCALTNSIQKINYKPAYIISQKMASAKVIKVEEMKDERGYADNKVIFYKKNMYNQTMSGAYVEEQPISVILINAIQQGLTNKGLNSGSENNSFVLRSWLQKLDYQTISGFTTVQLIPEITVKFQLIDANSKVVWTDVITGKSNTKGANFEKFMPPAIDDLVLKLIENQEFLNEFK